eukprot:333661_1
MTHYVTKKRKEKTLFSTMLSFFALTIYTIALILHHVHSTGHNTFCATGSAISSQVDGKYEYKDTNTNGFIYYSNKLNLYLFPWIESDTFKQYLIGPNPSIHSAYSFSTIQSLSPYKFNENDFLKNWQSYIPTNNTNEPTLKNDKSMRLISCTPICIESILYEWITYNISIETSIYYNASNDLYLYRSNIGPSEFEEEWQIYNNKNNIYYTLSIKDINIGSCMHTNISINMANIPKYANVNQNKIITNNKQDKYGVIATLFAATSAIFLVFIFMASLIKKYVLDNEEKNLGIQKNKNKNVNKVKKLRKKSSTNKLQIMVTTPSINGEQIKYNNQQKSTLSINTHFSFSSDDENNGNNIPIRKMTNSVLSNSPRSYRSNSKYADFLPFTKPPPIGMRPILTAKQQSIRPLPLTPPANRMFQRKHTV